MLRADTTENELVLGDDQRLLQQRWIAPFPRPKAHATHFYRQFGELFALTILVRAP